MPRKRQQETEEFKKPPWVIAIKQMRIDSDMTQSQVAGVLGISQRVYADYELGRCRIPVRLLVMLADHYNVSMDHLCKREM